MKEKMFDTDFGVGTAQGRATAPKAAIGSDGSDIYFAALAQHTRKTGKRLPAQREYLTFDPEADNERYYWSNRIELVDGKVIITPVLRRVED